MPLWVAYALLLGIVFLFGACVGSFLGVVADRVPRGQSIVRGRSFCPHPLRKADDAIVVDTSDMNAEEAIAAVTGLCRSAR